MKAIKMTGLDDKVRDYMRALRQEEIDKSTATRWIKVRMTFLRKSSCSPTEDILVLTTHSATGLGIYPCIDFHRCYLLDNFEEGT